MTPQRNVVPIRDGEAGVYFATIEDAIRDIRDGKLVVVVDDEDRENEGDLTLAAEKIRPEVINFMAKYGRGLICLALTPERLDELQIPMMVTENTSNYGTAFCVSIEAKHKVTTGISAADRARTILAAIDPATRPNDLARPGHIFPLRSRRGGVLVRAGQTEASVDLARIAGLKPAGVICEIMNEDGSMARVPQLVEFCRTHQLKMITVADLIKYRMRTERYVHPVAETTLSTKFGDFRMIAYESMIDGETHIALVKGNISDGEPVMVRVHSHCLTGDVLGSTTCDCQKTIEAALTMIAHVGRGVFVYLHQTGRGFGLQMTDGKYEIAYHGHSEKDRGDGEGVHINQREIGIGSQILSSLNLHRIRILTKHPRKLVALEGYGITIVEHVPFDTN
ncbi:MAG: 3,4-dihydroxy-2-butanone-4-phosphate synthase [Acidobacteriia bacterium]|nr:3,4-dihydroxy-2-butanone-4-phosphate synthase [Terriglobia bacterium]